MPEEKLTMVAPDEKVRGSLPASDFSSTSVL